MIFNDLYMTLHLSFFNEVEISVGMSLQLSFIFLKSDVFKKRLSVYVLYMGFSLMKLKSIKMET